MRAVVAWQETPVCAAQPWQPNMVAQIAALTRLCCCPQPEKDGIRNVCYDLCFKPGQECQAAGKAETIAISRHDILAGSNCAELTLFAHADGSQLVAGVGARVLVYDASDGELLHALKGHKV
jgi:hypothetical protein